MATKTQTTKTTKTARRTARKGARKAARRTPRKAAPPVSKSGAAITEELAEQLADEAEQGYDLTRGRRVGRPSLAGAGVSPRVNFRTTRSLHERARRVAIREGKTISALAREALERYVGRS